MRAIYRRPDGLSMNEMEYQQAEGYKHNPGTLTLFALNIRDYDHITTGR